MHLKPVISESISSLEVVVFKCSLLLFIHTSAGISLLGHHKLPLSLARMHRSSNPVMIDHNHQLLL